jgi:SEC-C motif domain protein
MSCFCCSGIAFEKCCQPYLLGTSKAPSAEKLMRSRYSAYASNAIGYLIRTTHPSTRLQYDPISIETWAKTSTWQKLEIISKQVGEMQDTKGKVEFKAYFLDSQKKPHIHHEHSNFKKEKDEWFFVDGVVISS